MTTRCPASVVIDNDNDMSDRKSSDDHDCVCGDVFWVFRKGVGYMVFNGLRGQSKSLTWQPQTREGLHVVVLMTTAKIVHVRRMVV